MANLFQDFEILTPHGWCDFKGIQKLEKRETLKITFEDFSSVVCTYDHRFIVNGIDIFAKDLKISDKLQSYKSFKTIMLIEENGLEDVYDILQVDNKDSSFYANDIISHNCRFEGSSKTLLNGPSLERIFRSIKEPIEKEEEEHFLIWKKPVRGRVYIAPSDVGAGSGSDNSVIVILDVTDLYINDSYSVAAVYKRNDINVFEFAAIAKKIAQRYNNASIICENNAVGLGGIFNNQLYQELEYDNIYYDYENKQPGINANSQTKPLSNTYFKEDVEADKFQIFQDCILKELRIYEEVKPGIYQAKRGDGNRDDLVAACRWGSYLLRTKWWEDNKDDFYKVRIEVITQNVESKKDEEDLETFNSLFSGNNIHSIEADMKDFERELNNWR